MLALDPPLGAGDATTIGGLVASADSGPLRHRYGGVRDLVLGITLALSDGTIAKAGSKVIKNVAGYDLGKLFTGSYGTLGLILDVTVRLHPKPVATATAFGASDDADVLAAAAMKLAGLPLEADSLDAAWQQGSGRLLARFGGAIGGRPGGGRRRADEGGRPGRRRDHRGRRGPLGRAARTRSARHGRAQGLRPRDRPRHRDPRDRAGRRLARLARRPRAVVDRARRRRPRAARHRRPRRRSQPRPVVLLDGPAGLRGDFDPWGPIDAGALQVMRRIKERFDTHRIFRPGAYLGGI